MCLHFVAVVFFFKQKTAYEMRISDWSSDVCSSDLFCSTVGSRQIVVGDAAEAERQIGDQMLGGEHFQDGQIGDGRQGVRAELQGCRAGPGSLEGHVLQVESHQLTDARAAVDMRDNLQQVVDRKSTRLNSSHSCEYSMPSSA